MPTPTPIQITAAAVAAFFGLFSVAAGAFAAHLLDPTSEPRALMWLEKASRYAMWHGLGLLALAALGMANAFVLSLFAGGVVLFSGSLAALALGAPRGLALITPFGGSLLLLAWIAVLLRALSAFRRRRTAGDAVLRGGPPERAH